MSLTILFPIINTYLSKKNLEIARNAKRVNNDAKYILRQGKRRLEICKNDCSNKLELLGSNKLNILNTSVKKFVEIFEKIKGVDFQEIVILNESYKVKVDYNSFFQLKQMTNWSSSILSKIVNKKTVNLLFPIGALGTNTIVSDIILKKDIVGALNSFITKNKSYSFFCNCLEKGGTNILGGLLDIPFLMVMGFSYMKVAADENIAYTNLAIAKENAEKMNIAADLCKAIVNRADLYINLLLKLNEYFLSAIEKMHHILQQYGANYNTYNEEQKKVVAAAASLAVSIKTIIDTPLLNEDGTLTEQSYEIFQNYEIISDDYISNYNLTNSQQLRDIINCCTYNKEFLDDRNNSIVACFKWEQLANMLNVSFGLSFTPEEYSKVITCFLTDYLYEIVDVENSCKKYICLCQLSQMLSFCLNNNNVSDCLISEQNIDLELLCKLLRTFYNIRVQKQVFEEVKKSGFYDLRNISDFIFNKLISQPNGPAIFTNYIFNKKLEPFIIKKNSKSFKENKDLRKKMDFMSDYRMIKRDYGKNMPISLVENLAKSHGLDLKSASEYIKETTGIDILV